MFLYKYIQLDYNQNSDNAFLKKKDEMRNK